MVIKLLLNVLILNLILASNRNNRSRLKVLGYREKEKMK